jgi:D-sedoheptulose 7-phosphate isomerase
VTVEELYPFLYDDTRTAEDGLFEEVRRSTTEKAAEIVALRERVVTEQAGAMEAAAASMAARFAAGGRLFTFGNGGSSTDAAGIAALFGHPARGRAVPALALASPVAVVTALANDVGFDVVFARQLAALAGPGDVALGVSTSGGSENVLRALEEGRRRGCLTVALAGYDGGRMATSGLVDHLFVIPSASVHRIQEAQTTVYHVLWSLVQDAFGDT